MIQHIVIALVFVAAVAYLGYLVYKNFSAKAGCSSGCGSCGLDVEKIRRELEQKQLR